MTIADLGFQPRPWEGLRSPPTSAHFDSFQFPQSNGRFIVRAVDVAPVNESCYPVDLFSRLTLPRTEDVRPESTFAFKMTFPWPLNPSPGKWKTKIGSSAFEFRVLLVDRNVQASLNVGRGFLVLFQNIVLTALQLWVISLIIDLMV